MTRTNPTLARIGFVAVVAACVVLSACGRRGPPEAPVATPAEIAEPAP